MKLKHFLTMAPIMVFPDFDLPGCALMPYSGFGCHLSSSTGEVGTDLLLGFVDSVAGRKELSSYQAGMFSHYVGDSYILP